MHSTLIIWSLSSGHHPVDVWVYVRAEWLCDCALLCRTTTGGSFIQGSDVDQRTNIYFMAHDSIQIGQPIVGTTINVSTRRF